MTDLTGYSLGRYHILDRLGEGGVATVYQAYDTYLEHTVAIKAINIDLQCFVARRTGLGWFALLLVIALFSSLISNCTMVIFSPAVTATPQWEIGSTYTGKDGMTLLSVSAGEFTMGSGNAEGDENSAHRVSLDAFWIDKTEVTNAMYALCVKAGACNPPGKYGSNTRNSYYDNAQYANYPVIWVFWSDAKRYCAWAGRRLPTEAEWEKAASGTDDRKYPWGNNPPDKNLANFNNNVGDTTQVGSYPAGASPYDALDMAGNVDEWVSDWDSDRYHSQSPSVNPSGPESGDGHVLRGGSFFSGRYSLLVSDRNWKYPGEMGDDLGFRCAMSAT